MISVIFFRIVGLNPPKSTHCISSAASNVYKGQHLDARLRLAAILHDGEDLGAVAAAWRDVLDIDPEHKLARRRLEETRDRVAAQASRIRAQD